MEITITIKLTDDELNNLFKKDEKEVEKKETNHRKDLSLYARRFDSSCAAWSKDPEMNLMFLKCQESYVNELLRTKGRLYLNEVYDALGIPRTKAGSKVGWRFYENNSIGDNYISFGIFEDYNADSVNGYVNVFWLDFNVDGLILDYI